MRGGHAAREFAASRRDSRHAGRFSLHRA